MEPNFKKINLANGNASLSPKVCFDIVFVNFRNFFEQPVGDDLKRIKAFFDKREKSDRKIFLQMKLDR